MSSIVHSDRSSHQLPVFPRGTRIPRIIHQTYPNKALPDPLRANVEQLIAMNPGWDHRLYDDVDIERFIQAAYGDQVLAAYHRINPDYGAARADFFRYLLIYKEGGVYLDIKSRFACPIDDVLNGDEAFVLAQWQNVEGEARARFGLHKDIAHVAGGEFQQWHVIAAPGHPYLHAVIERVMDNIRTYRPWRQGVGRAGTLRVTGPIAYTLAIAPIRDAHPHRQVPSEVVIGLEYSLGAHYRHGEVFTRHYSTLDTPVVRMGGLSRLLLPVFSVAYRLRARYRARRLER
jgi:inositol phosphorylceramide mannosyltransferase catalytic subunit